MNRETIERLKKEYPVGCTISLIEMDDKQAPPVGTRGVVIGIDDVGSLLVHWSNGSHLNVLYGVDRVKRV